MPRTSEAIARDQAIALQVLMAENAGFKSVAAHKRYLKKEAEKLERAEARKSLRMSKNAEMAAKYRAKQAERDAKKAEKAAAAEVKKKEREAKKAERELARAKREAAKEEAAEARAAKKAEKAAAAEAKKKEREAKKAEREAKKAEKAAAAEAKKKEREAKKSEKKAPAEKKPRVKKVPVDKPKKMVTQEEHDKQFMKNRSALMRKYKGSGMSEVEINRMAADMTNAKLIVEKAPAAKKAVVAKKAATTAVTALPTMSDDAFGSAVPIMMKPMAVDPFSSIMANDTRTKLTKAEFNKKVTEAKKDVKAKNPDLDKDQVDAFARMSVTQKFYHS